MGSHRHEIPTRRDRLAETIDEEAVAGDDLGLLVPVHAVVAEDVDRADLMPPGVAGRLSADESKVAVERHRPPEGGVLLRIARPEDLLAPQPLSCRVFT